MTMQSLKSNICGKKSSDNAKAKTVLPEHIVRHRETSRRMLDGKYWERVRQRSNTIFIFKKACRIVSVQISLVIKTTAVIRHQW